MEEYSHTSRLECDRLVRHAVLCSNYCPCPVPPLHQEQSCHGARPAESQARTHKEYCRVCLSTLRALDLNKAGLSPACMGFRVITPLPLRPDWGLVAGATTCLIDKGFLSSCMVPAGTPQ